VVGIIFEIVAVSVFAVKGDWRNFKSTHKDIEVENSGDVCFKDDGLIWPAHSGYDCESPSDASSI
jgi:hypothetical protein